MYRNNLFNALQFDDHAIIDNQVNAITNLDQHAVIQQRQLNFFFCVMAVLAQLVGDTCPISAFE